MNKECVILTTAKKCQDIKWPFFFFSDPLNRSGYRKYQPKFTPNKV